MTWTAEISGASDSQESERGVIERIKSFAVELESAAVHFYGSHHRGQVHPHDDTLPTVEASADAESPVGTVTTADASSGISDAVNIAPVTPAP
jgi:hypothetical protein